MKEALFALFCVAVYFGIGGATSQYKTQYDPHCWFNQSESRWVAVDRSGDYFAGAFWPLYWMWHAGEKIAGFESECRWP